METIYHEASSRGKFNLGWLDSKHTFSFGHYHNPKRMGFGLLRVLNDDVVQPAYGFETHPHRDMEIVSIPLHGSLKHKDSEGNEHEIHTDEIQRMSAGTGILHSEFNGSQTEVVNFLQIWILPEKKGIRPAYQQQSLEPQAYQNQFALMVSPDGRQGSLSINQRVYFSRLALSAGNSVEYPLYATANGVYVFVIKGAGSVSGVEYHSRDGLGLRGADKLQFKAQEASEFVVIETPV